MKKTILLTTSAALLALTGCTAAPVSDSSRDPVSAVTMRSEKAYRLREIAVPADTSGLLAICPMDSGWFIAAGGMDEPPQFYTADSGFGGFSEVVIPMEGDNTRFAPVVCTDGNEVYMAVTAMKFHGDMKDTSSAEYSHALYKIGSDGAVLSQTGLSGIGDREIYSIAAADGKLYAVTDTLCSIDPESGTASECKTIFGSGLGVSADGALMNCVPDGMDCALDIGGRKLSLKGCGSPVTNIAAGGGYDAVFATSTTICAVSGNTITELAAAVSLGLQSRSIREIFPNSDEFILVVFDSALEKYRLMAMTDAPEEERHDEVTLKLGIFAEEDDLDSFLAQFNSMDSYVKIEPIYYNRYDEYDKAAKRQVRTALEQLNLDIISGNAPDIAQFMDVPQYLAEKGAFADIYGIMDDELGRDDILPNVLQACETDGKLTSLPTTFMVRSLLCRDEYSPVKDQTFEEMMDIINNAPAGKMPFRKDKTELLIDILAYSDYAASYSDGLYTVNCDNIRRVLELCGSMPEPSELADMPYPGDDLLFYNTAGGSFADLAQMHSILGEGLTYAGFPTENRCGTVIDPVHSVAVLEGCTDKAAAWEFIKKMYESPALINGINSGFPVTVRAFDAQCGTLRKNMPDMADKLIEAVTSAHSLGSGIDSSLYPIILDEAQMYFEEQYTAEQAAEYIRSRAEIFVSERS